MKINNQRKSGSRHEITKDVLHGIGIKIRVRRKERSYTLATLAEKTGFTKGYISQVERGLAYPSIFALSKMAISLDVPLSHFFSEDEHRVKKQVEVSRRNQRTILRYPNSPVKYEIISLAPDRLVEFLYLRESPGTRSGTSPFQHNGEEAIFVVSGTMEYHVGEEKFVLEAGDGIWHISSMPHKWKAIGDEDLQLVSAVTPPTF